MPHIWCPSLSLNEFLIEDSVKNRKQHTLRSLYYVSPVRVQICQSETCNI
jgi:hypothetical protein